MDWMVCCVGDIASWAVVVEERRGNVREDSVVVERAGVKPVPDMSFVVGERGIGWTGSSCVKVMRKGIVVSRVERGEDGS